jgi:hypothetical protein
MSIPGIASAAGIRGIVGLEMTTPGINQCLHDDDIAAAILLRARDEGDRCGRC